MKIAICVTNFKNDLREAISKNAFQLSSEISKYYDTTLLVPGSIDRTIKHPSELTIESYCSKRHYSSKVRVIWNCIALGAYFKNRPNEFDLLHFHVGNLLELFILRLTLSRICSTRVVTVWQPYMSLSEFFSLPKLFGYRILRVLHHYLANTWIHIPFFAVGQKYFDVIVVSSIYQKNQLKFVDKRKIAVIPNGVARSAKEKSGFTRSPKKLLYIGHGTFIKGLDIFLEALRQIRGKTEFIVTMAISDFGSIRKIRDWIKQYGLQDLTVLKDNIDVYDEMADHDLFVYPLKGIIGTTHYPNVLLECYAVGLPIVISSLESVNEAIIDGKTGFLVPAGNPKKLGDVIVDAISQENVLHAMSRIQRGEYIRKYTLEKYVQSHLRLYVSLTNKNSVNNE